MHFGICAFSWQSPLTPAERLRCFAVMEICLRLFSHSDVPWNRCSLPGYAGTDDSDALEFWIRSYIYYICWITEVSEILCNFTNANPFTLRLRFIASQVSVLKIRFSMCWYLDIFSISNSAVFLEVPSGFYEIILYTRYMCITIFTNTTNWHSKFLLNM